jgi:hypothetical protein
MNPKVKEFLFNPFTLFLTAWGILNLVQARLTPLDNDEAYYWMYSKYLAWGYFDHPPMIALMVKIGYLFFHNELGVRLVVVLSQLVALYVVWLLTDEELREKKENILLFFMLVAVLPVWNIFSFVATPDSPLILFTAVFLLIYKRFLSDSSWRNTLFLSFSIAALMYSKYHSGLLIILVILANPGLLKNIRFYAAAFIAFVLFSPHLLWQYTNDFPSFKYHLIDRVSGFNPEHAPEYLLSQFSFHNPFLITILVWLMFRVRSRNTFDRTLKYIIAGFLIFFFISSFRYRVEPQWTALICVPMIIILLNNSGFRPWLRNYFRKMAIILFPLFIIARLASAVDILPVSFFKNEFHNKKQWVKDIDALAGDRTVVFTNSYQRPAVFTFYTGKFAYSLNNLNYRKTQYDIWKFEEQVHGKRVLYVPHYFSDFYRANLTKRILSTGDSIFVKTFDNFQSLQKECVVLDKDFFTFSRSATDTIHLKIFNPYPYIIDLKHKELPVVFQVAFLKNGLMQVKRNLDLPGNITQLNVGDTISVSCSFTLEDLPEGVYKVGICSETGILYDTFNSKLKTARISD